MSDDSSDETSPKPETTPAEPRAPELIENAVKDEAAKAEAVKADVVKADVVKIAKAPPATPVLEPMTPGLWLFLLVVSASSAALDLWSKAWAMKTLSREAPDPRPLCTPPPGMSNYFPQRIPNHDVTLVRDFLDLQYAENCGGAWGLLHGASEKFRKPFFMVVTIGAIVFIVHLYRTLEKGQRSMRIALPLVLGGAIGNLVDRIRLGYVVDFIHAHWRNKAHWPTFNVADIAITVGICLMLLEYILGPKPSARPKADAPKPEAAKADAPKPEAEKADSPA